MSRHGSHLQGPDITIHHPESVLDNMNDWCKEHHNKSGLVQRVRDSTTSLQEAEQKVRTACLIRGQGRGIQLLQTAKVLPCVQMYP